MLVEALDRSTLGPCWYSALPVCKCRASGHRKPAFSPRHLPNGDTI